MQVAAVFKFKKPGNQSAAPDLDCVFYYFLCLVQYGTAGFQYAEKRGLADPGRSEIICYL